jgi:hypothetical protein
VSRWTDLRDGMDRFLMAEDRYGDEFLCTR